MKKLLWTTLLCSALAHLAAGCIIVTDPPPDPPPPPPGPGFLDVTWTLTAGVNDVPIAGCVEGVTTEVVTENIATRAQYIDLFDCADSAGRTSQIAPGDYDVWVNVYNRRNLATADLIAQSGFLRVRVRSNEIVPVRFFFPAGGFFTLTWSITDDFGPDAECDDVAADGVSVLSTLVGPNTAIDDIFDCFRFEATTPQMLLGNYVVSVSLLDGNRSLNRINVADAYSLDYGNQVEDLGHFEFELTP
jgi:hypothetical protein